MMVLFTSVPPTLQRANKQERVKGKVVIWEKAKKILGETLAPINFAMAKK